MKMLAFFRLARFDKPIGIMLLWAPTAWALWLANHGHPDPRIVILFFLGTILMRAAGCVINDIADRQIDLHVERTKFRPLTAGDISLIEAFVFLAGLLATAVCILLQLPRACFYSAIPAVGITFIYPFCKRFFSAPQLILGLAFSMSIPMAYVASNAPLDSQMFLLFLLNLLWTIAYDTEYALVDRADDLRIGIRSTAILFGSYSKMIIALLHIGLHLLWLVMLPNLTQIFFCFWTISFCLLVYQQFLLYQKREAAYFQAFLLNGWYGLSMWLALACSDIFAIS